MKRLAAEIGNGAGAFAVDTADAAAVDDLPVRVSEALGPIEILVLNTGGPPPGGALEASDEDWEAAFRSLV